MRGGHNLPLKDYIFHIGGSFIDGKIIFFNKSLSIENFDLLINKIKLDPKQSPVNELSLQNCHIDSKKFRHLLPFVGKKSIRVQCLLLHFNELSPSCMRSLANELKSNSNLHTINLGSNNIEDAGAITLFEGLQNNTSVQKLLLFQCGFTQKVSKNLVQLLEKNSTLTHLHLYDNNLGEKGGVSIGEALMKNSTLKYINLSNCKIQDNGLVVISEGLKVNQSLEQLILSANEITKLSMTELSLALKTNNKLQLLDLSSNILDEGVAALGEALEVNHSIRNMYLQACGLNDEVFLKFCKSLKKNQGLIELKVSNNLLTTKSSCTIREHLKFAKSLQKLYIDGNQIGDSGTISLAACLRDGGALLELDLRRNDVNNSGMQSLGASLLKSKLQTLRIGRNKMDSFLGFEVLKNSSNLQALCLSGSSLKEEGWKILCTIMEFNTSIQKLALKDAKVDVNRFNALTTALTKNKTLKELDLSANKFSKSSALKTLLNGSKSLEVLLLNDCNLGDNGFFAMFDSYQSTSIRILELQGNLLTDSSLQLLLLLVQNCPKSCINVQRNKISIEKSIEIVSSLSGKDRKKFRLELLNQYSKSNSTIQGNIVSHQNKNHNKSNEVKVTMNDDMPDTIKKINKKRKKSVVQVDKMVEIQNKATNKQIKTESIPKVNTEEKSLIQKVDKMKNDIQVLHDKGNDVSENAQNVTFDKIQNMKETSHPSQNVDENGNNVGNLKSENKHMQSSVNLLSQVKNDEQNLIVEGLKRELDITILERDELKARIISMERQHLEMIMGIQTQHEVQTERMRIFFNTKLEEKDTEIKQLHQCLHENEILKDDFYHDSESFSPNDAQSKTQSVLASMFCLTSHRSITEIKLMKCILYISESLEIANFIFGNCNSNQEIFKKFFNYVFSPKCRLFELNDYNSYTVADQFNFQTEMYAAGEILFYSLQLNYTFPNQLSPLIYYVLMNGIPTTDEEILNVFEMLGHKYIDSIRQKSNPMLILKTLRKNLLGENYCVQNLSHFYYGFTKSMSDKDKVLLACMKVSDFASFCNSTVKMNLPESKKQNANLNASVDSNLNSSVYSNLNANVHSNLS